MTSRPRSQPVTREAIAKAMFENLVPSVDGEGLPIISGFNSATNAIMALLSTPSDGAREAMDDGLEVLTNLMESIGKHGNFSDESTVNFIDQAAQCFRKARSNLPHPNCGVQNGDDTDKARAWDAVAAARLDERKKAIEECAMAAEAQARGFLSPEYAANQPFGSFCERFACEEVAKAIRSLAVSSADRGRE